MYSGVYARLAWVCAPSMDGVRCDGERGGWICVLYAHTHISITLHQTFGRAPYIYLIYTPNDPITTPQVNIYFSTPHYPSPYGVGGYNSVHTLNYPSPHTPGGYDDDPYTACYSGYRGYVRARNVHDGREHVVKDEFGVDKTNSNKIKVCTHGARVWYSCA